VIIFQQLHRCETKKTKKKKELGKDFDEKAATCVNPIQLVTALKYHIKLSKLTLKNFERPDLGRWLFWAASDIPKFYYF
jgi:hypothetical protein